VARETVIKSGQVRVVEKFRLEGLIGGKKRTYEETEELVLKPGPEKGPAGWKIVSGSGVYSILAGRPLEEDSVLATLAKRVSALKTKDLALFREVIDPQYDFHGKDFNSVVAEMDDHFKSYESIELILDKPYFRFYPGRVEVGEGYRLRAVRAGETKEFNDREKLELRKTENGWKISKGL